MARIRTIKPEYWADEKMGRLTPLERLTFLGLMSIADDAGRLVDSVKLIDGALFPYTDDSCADALATLASLGRIQRYESASGQRLIQLTRWKQHQKVDHASSYVLPGPGDSAAIDAVTAPPAPEAREGVAKDTRTSREALATVSRTPRAPILDRGPVPPTNNPSASSARETPGPSIASNPNGNGAAPGHAPSSDWPLVTPEADWPASGRDDVRTLAAAVPSSSWPAWRRRFGALVAGEERTPVPIAVLAEGVTAFVANGDAERPNWAHFAGYLERQLRIAADHGAAATPPVGNGRAPPPGRRGGMTSGERTHAAGLEYFGGNLEGEA